MHTIEPFYNWQHIYVSENDERSPFYGVEHSEFEYSNAIYNFYIHPQWDEFGSRTLYLKILMADYDEAYAIIELLGEWNDAVEADMMVLKRTVLEKLMDEGIFHFIFIAENVLNFHSSDAEYYEELYDELNDNKGWAVCLNMPSGTRHDYIKAHLDNYIPLLDLYEWRTFKPFHLYKKIITERQKFIENNNW